MRFYFNNKLRMFYIRLKLLPAFFFMLGSILLIETTLVNSSALLLLPDNCDSTKCVLPDCLCISTTVPKGLNPKEIPQMVFLTFDDTVSDKYCHITDRILENRVNPNGCNISMTFFVSHDDTNYQLVNKYFNTGNEIASHAITHKEDYSYWANTTVDFWEREAGQQMEIINAHSKVPLDRIKGFRAPYLQTGGDATFSALRSMGMSFDSSLIYPTKQFTDPPIWPFTLDYGVTFDCQVPPCSNERHPGLWEVPLLHFKNGVNGSICSMADTCFTDSTTVTAKEVYDFFLFNFERYNENRAPFGIFQHVWWILENDAILEGFLQFLDYLGTLDYVYIVTISQGLEWIKNPTTLKETDIFGCQGSLDQVPCQDPQICTYNDSVPGGVRTMGSCTFCPSEFPWLDKFESIKPSIVDSILPLILLLLIIMPLITYMIHMIMCRVCSRPKILKELNHQKQF